MVIIIGVNFVFSFFFWFLFLTFCRSKNSTFVSESFGSLTFGTTFLLHLVRHLVSDSHFWFYFVFKGLLFRIWSSCSIRVWRWEVFEVDWTVFFVSLAFESEWVCPILFRSCISWVEVCSGFRLILCFWQWVIFQW